MISTMMIIALSLNLLCLCLLIRIEFSEGLDVSFIPNDENAPLPLSTKYRASLRRLCMILKTQSNKNNKASSISDDETQSTNVLADLQKDTAKYKALQSLCKKLAADDANILMASKESSLLSRFLSMFSSQQPSSSNSGSPTFLWLSAGVGGVTVLLYTQKEKILRLNNRLQRYFRRILSSTTVRDKTKANLNLLSGGSTSDDDKPEDKKPPSPNALRAARLRHFSSLSNNTPASS